jgi:hypothetical protein
MPPKKRICKTRLEKLTKPILLDLAKSIGFIEGNGINLKSDIIKFILENYNDDIVESLEVREHGRVKFETSSSYNDSLPKSESDFDNKEKNKLKKLKKGELYNKAKSLGFSKSQNVLKDEMVNFILNFERMQISPSQSMIESIQETASDEDILRDILKCENLEDIMNILAKYPKMATNRDVISYIKNLPEKNSFVEKTSHKTDTPNHFNNFHSTLSKIDSSLVQETSMLDSTKSIVYPLVEDIQDVEGAVNTWKSKTNSLGQSYIPQSRSETEVAKETILVNQIKGASDITEILTLIKDPLKIHLSKIADVDYEIAKTFGFIPT